SPLSLHGQRVAPAFISKPPLGAPAVSEWSLRGHFVVTHSSADRQLQNRGSVGNGGTILGMSTPVTKTATDLHAAAELAPAPERFLPLQGTLNTRDLGGLPVAAGGVTRYGRFFRSDGPLALTDADVAMLLE